MKKYHLSLDDTFEESFHLFAIYSDEESYRMAFLINLHLALHLHKSKSIIRKKDSGVFTVYEYNDKSNYQDWYLIHNHSLLESNTNSTDLFSQESSIFQTKIFYIKELKNAPFLLKVVADVDAAFLRSTLKKLQKISQVFTAELIDLTQLKNQKLLIF